MSGVLPPGLDTPSGIPASRTSHQFEALLRLLFRPAAASPSLFGEPAPEAAEQLPDPSTMLSLPDEAFERVAGGLGLGEESWKELRKAAVCFVLDAAQDPSRHARPCPPSRLIR